MPHVVTHIDDAVALGEVGLQVICETRNFLARKQLDYPRLRRRVIAVYERFDADIVLIENASSGLQLAQDLRYEGELQPVRWKPRGDKVVRLETHSVKIESGYVRLPERAPWLDAFTSELLVPPMDGMTTS